MLDAIVGRRSRILDAGCGSGRVGAELYRRGHQVVGVDADPVVIAAALADHPGPEWLVGDLADPLGEADLLDEREPFDAVICAGNVLVYVAPGTERRVVAAMARSLRPDGVLVTGFTVDGRYPPGHLDRDASEAGLVLEQRFATWDLRPWHEGAEFVVSVHRLQALQRG